MKKSDEIKLKNFCKSVKVVGSSMDDLYKKFSEHNSIPRADFELGMLELNRTPAQLLKMGCITYYLNEKEFGFEKFCKEHCHVTKEFWNTAIVEAVLPEDEQRYFSEQLPEGWDELHWVKKEQFINEQKNPKFIYHIFSRGGQNVVLDACRGRLKKLKADQPPPEFTPKVISPDPDPIKPSPKKRGRPKKMEAEIITTSEKSCIVKVPEVIVSESPLPLPPVNLGFDEGDEFKKLLPSNWARMTNSDRVEFAQKIQHEKFRDYVISLDPSLRNFFSRHKARPTKFNLYVTLFQFPAENYSEESKNLLKCFIENLNTLGRANLQYVECTNPHVVEVREVR